MNMIKWRGSGQDKSEPLAITLPSTGYPGATLRFLSTVEPVAFSQMIGGELVEVFVLDCSEGVDLIAKPVLNEDRTEVIGIRWERTRCESAINAE